ncbi:response regulator [Demetria terragena]|uniref:response regulator n=1 Tax=Demetria terragena TaxID=63959 RepID=UPI00035FEC63|nr:response regulator transcription factor [Demetria terragena]
MTKPIRLMLVDDQAMVRAGFRMVLDAQSDMVVAAEATNGQEALDRLRPDPGAIDLVLMDIRMPRLDGVAATTEIMGFPSPPRVLVLTTFDLDEYVYAALRAGAAGFLLKDAGPEELLSAIRAVHGGDSVVAPSATKRLLEAVLPSLPGAADSDRDRLQALTPREHEVLIAVGRGLSNSEISAALFLAEPTVKTHIGRVLAKLGLRDRVQMVVLCYETGLVIPGDG